MACLKVLPLMVLLTLLHDGMTGEYCDTFEDGDFGQFWQQSHLDQGGKWIASKYSDLKKTIPDFPKPARGNEVVYLTPNQGTSYASARILTTQAFKFPAGSNMTLRYWLRSQYAGSGTLEIRRVIDNREEVDPIGSLTSLSGPTNDNWATASFNIPTDAEEFKIVIFAATSVGKLSNIAVDDIIISGPEGLNHDCTSMTTTPVSLPTTISATPTTTTAIPPTTTTPAAPTTNPTTTPAPVPPIDVNVDVHVDVNITVFLKRLDEIVKKRVKTKLEDQKAR